MICEWDTARFLIFSDNVFDPLIYYSHFTAIAIFIGLISLTFLKLKPWPKNAFRVMALSYIVWLACDLVLWGNEKPDHIMFFWTIVNMVEPIIFASAYAYFVAFSEKRLFTVYEKILIFVLLIPTLVMAPFGLSTVGFDYTNCDRNVIEGIAAYYNYFLEAVFILMILFQGIRQFVKVRQDARMISRLLLAMMSLMLLLVSFLLTNFLGTYSGDYTFNQFGHIAVPIFAAILVYITIKFETLEPRIMVVDTLSVALSILLFSLFFIRNEDTQLYIIALTFILSLPLVISLIAGIRKEIKLRRQIETLLEELRMEKESVEQKVVERTAQLDKIAKGLVRRDFELAQANEELRQLDLLKSEFVTVAAHQLRTPLSGLKWALDMFLRGDAGTLTSEQRNILLKSYENNDRMIRLVNDLLSVDRIDSGKLEYHFVPTQILEVMEDVLFEMTPSISKKKLEMSSVNKDRNLPQVPIDTEKMRSVLQNLLENAVKYTPLGGKVEINFQVVGGFVRISIKDSGIGILEEDKKNVFKRFFRAKNAVKVVPDGTGLGLFIAKGIIEKHGGKIWFESNVEGGTTFHFTLPIAK